MKTYGGRRFSLVFNLYNRSRLIGQNRATSALYLKSFQCLLHRRLFGPQKQPGHAAEKPLPLPGIELQSFSLYSVTVVISLETMEENVKGGFNNSLTLVLN